VAKTIAKPDIPSTASRRSGFTGSPAAISTVVCSLASIEVAKIDFLVAEHGEAVSVMRAIKRADRPRQHNEPGNIWNASARV
jgi:hypothetical protein